MCDEEWHQTTTTIARLKECLLEPCSSVRVKQGMEGQVSDKGTTEILPFSIVLCVDGMKCVAFSLCTC